MKRLYTPLPADLRPADAPWPAESHTASIREEASRHYGSKDSLLRWYLWECRERLPALGFLAGSAGGFRSVFSLGAGCCVMEYLLSLAMPPGTGVVASDYDPLYVETAKRHFPEITAVRYDFLREDVGLLVERSGRTPDLAVFFGSSYVLDDAGFVRLLEGLKRAGARRVVDFSAGVQEWKDLLWEATFLPALKRVPAVRRAFGRPPVGQFHGYGRTKGELRRIYGKAGWRIHWEGPVACYRYVAVLGG